jgi:hypothetical protein
MMAVGRALEATLLPSFEAVLPHQPSGPTPANSQAAVLQVSCHAGTAICFVREGEGGPDMGEQNQIVPLTRARGTTPPGEVAALADAEDFAQALDRELLFRRIDELEPHRLPSLAKKAVAFFRISRS